MPDKSNLESEQNVVPPNAVDAPGRGRQTSSSQILQPGEVWNARFQIVSVLGEGGLATVYKAVQLQLGLPVVLKILNANKSSAAGVKRFMREARLLSAIKHQNVVSLYCFGQDEKRLPFMALEFIEGESLAEVIARDHCLEAYRTVQIIRQLCSALESARIGQIVHRDLKPSNIILTQSPEGEEIPKIIDFGVARETEPDVNQAVTGVISGDDGVKCSPAYMSPEQCQGLPVDSRSDIYSVGCLLFEMLCGVPPFKFDSPLQTMDAHIRQKVESVPAKVALPEALPPIILKCLQKNPADRFKTPADLDTALGSITWDAQKFAGVPTAPRSRRSYLNASLGLLILMICACTLWVALQHKAPENVVFHGKKGGNGLLSPVLERPSELAEYSTAEKITYYSQWLGEHGKGDRLDVALAHQLLGAEQKTLGITGNLPEEHFEKAATMLRSLIEKNASNKNMDLSDTYDAYIQLQSAYRQLDKPAAAVIVLQHALTSLPVDLSAYRRARLHYELASAALAQQDVIMARDNLKKALALYSTEPSKYDEAISQSLYADCIARLGQRKLALALLQKTDEETEPDLNPRHAKEWLALLASRYFILGAYKESLAARERLEGLDSAYSARSEAVKVTVLLGQKKWNAARKSLEMILNRADESSIATFWDALSSYVTALAAAGETQNVEELVSTGLVHQPQAALDRVQCVAKMCAAAHALVTAGRQDLASEVLDRCSLWLTAEKEVTAADFDSFIFVMRENIVVNRAENAVKLGEYLQHPKFSKLLASGDRVRFAVAYSSALAFAGNGSQASRILRHYSDSLAAGDSRDKAILELTQALVYSGERNPEYLTVLKRATALLSKGFRAQNSLTMVIDMHLWSLIRGDVSFAGALYDSIDQFIGTTDGATRFDFYQRMGLNYMICKDYRKALSIFLKAEAMPVSLSPPVETKLRLLDAIVRCSLEIKRHDLATKYQNLIANILRG